MPLSGRGQYQEHEWTVEVDTSIDVGGVPLDKWAYIADRPCTLIGATEIHTVAATTCTLDLKKTPAGTVQAPASGTTMLASPFNLASTANTPVAGSLSATAANLRLSPGDQVGVDITNTTIGSYVTGLVRLTFRADPSG